MTINRSSPRFVIAVDIRASNGHHMKVADLLRFADEIREAGLSDLAEVIAEHNYETKHFTGIRAVERRRTNE